MAANGTRNLDGRNDGRRAGGRSIALALVATLAFAGAADATSYVMMSDEELAAGASVIVVGTVTGIDSGSNGGYHTDYAVRVERLLKGEDPGPAVMVRLIGGEGLEGDELRVVGSPSFAVGDQAILFLDAQQDGAYPLHQFFLGAFRRVAQASGAVAVRDLAEAEEILIPGRQAVSEANVERDFDGFAEWLTEGAERIGDELPGYVRERSAPAAARVTSAYTSISSDTVRWFEFDRGGYVTYFADKTGMHGTAADVFGMVSRALQAWSTVEGAKVNLRFGGTTTISKPFSASDRLNGVLWNDPFGEVSGSFDCARGGVLAIGGVKRGSGAKSFANGSALQIVEGDVVINDGAACFFERNGGLDGEEVLGHELGHSLGFGHSKDKAALMWASAKGNGRGCALGADDIAGLYFLYPGAPGMTVQPGSLTLDAAGMTGAEGSTVTLTVQRVGGSTGAASVRVTTKPLTAKSPADFGAVDQTLSWAHGDASPRTVTVAIAADAAKETAEKFRVSLTAAAGATLGAVQLTDVIIQDGQAASAGGASRVAMAASAATTGEADGFVTVTVGRSGGSGAVTATWQLIDATAKAGADYVAAKGSVRWAAGDTAPKKIRVKLVNDRSAEPQESFLVKLLGATGGASLGDLAATAVKILDDDAN